MKKTTLVISAILFSGSVSAAPFLISVPYTLAETQPTSFDVTVDGNTQTVAPVKNSSGQNYLKYDLAGITSGNKTASVTASNVWGTSAPATFTFTAAKSAAPSGLSLSAQ